jgi:transcriptional regulator with XRE-family HTH domain
MGDDSFPISEGSKKSLEELGWHIRTNRIARCMTQQLLCSYTDLSRSTLQQIEKGSPHVSIGNYARVLDAMGIQNHFGRVVLNDLEWARSQMRTSMRKRFKG